MELSVINKREEHNKARREKYANDPVFRKKEQARLRRINNMKYRSNPLNRLYHYKYSSAARIKIAISKGKDPSRYEWHITDEEGLECMDKPCWYCLKPATKDQLNGIDRIDEDRGYYSDNICSCCKICEYGKAARGTRVTAQDYHNHLNEYHDRRLALAIKA